MHAFFSPPESITQTSCRSLQPFLHSSQHRVVRHARGTSLTLKIAPSHREIWIPSNTWFLKPTRAHNQNSISIGSAVFVQLTAVSSSMHRHVISPKICTSDRWSGPPSNIWFLGSIRLSSPNGISIVSAVFAQLKAHSHYTLQWATSFPKWPFPLVYLEHHLVRLLGPVRSHNPNGISISSAVFLHRSPQSVPILYNGPSLSPSKFPLPMGDMNNGPPFSPLKISPSHGGCGPHLIHGSLGQPKSSTQMVSPLVQPFCRAHYCHR